MSKLTDLAETVIQNKSRSIDVDKALLDGIERLEAVVEAAIDVSLAQDGIFEMYKGYMTTRESTLSALNEALEKLNRGEG